MPLQGPLSVERMCCLAEVNRAGFYRYLRDGWWAEENMALHSAVQNLLIEHRWRYGYRRVTAELRARGMLANHKRVARIMSEDNLLAVYRNWHRPPCHSVISRDELLNEVWGYESYPCTRTVDNHVLRLRQKLERDPSHPAHIRTMYGVGYKFLP
jgi:hypothetical protein